MSDQDAARQELDDWRDLVTSGGWKRLLESFESQWGDKSVIQTLETLVVHKHANMAEETSEILKLRSSMRSFLAHPSQRIDQLERQRAEAAKGKSEPWKRPA